LAAAAQHRVPVRPKNSGSSCPSSHEAVPTGHEAKLCAEWQAGRFNRPSATPGSAGTLAAPRACLYEFLLQRACRSVYSERVSCRPAGLQEMVGATRPGLSQSHRLKNQAAMRRRRRSKKRTSGNSRPRPPGFPQPARVVSHALSPVRHAYDSYGPERSF